MVRLLIYALRIAVRVPDAVLGPDDDPEPNPGEPSAWEQWVADTTSEIDNAIRLVAGVEKEIDEMRGDTYRYVEEDDEEDDVPAVDDDFPESLENDGLWGASDFQNERAAQDEARFEAELFGGA